MWRRSWPTARAAHGGDGRLPVMGAATTQSRWAGASRPDGLASVVAVLRGFGDAAVAGAVDANAYDACSATPYLTAPAHPGGSAVYVSLIALTGDRVVPGALRESVVAAVDGDTVSVGFPDGERFEVVLGAEPAYARCPVAGGRCAGPLAAALTPPRAESMVCNRFQERCKGGRWYGDRAKPRRAGGPRSVWWPPGPGFPWRRFSRILTGSFPAACGPGRRGPGRHRGPAGRIPAAALRTSSSALTWWYATRSGPVAEAPSSAPSRRGQPPRKSMSKPLDIPAVCASVPLVDSRDH